MGLRVSKLKQRQQLKGLTTFLLEQKDEEIKTLEVSNKALEAKVMALEVQLAEATVALAKAQKKGKKEEAPIVAEQQE